MCQFFLHAVLPCCIWKSVFGYQYNILNREKVVAVTCGYKEENYLVNIVRQEDFVLSVLEGSKVVP